MNKIFVLIFGASLLLTGCDTKPSEEIGYGTIVNGVYKNDYFSMSIEVPKNWFVQSEAAQKQLIETGSNLISSEDENLKRVLKEVEKQTVSMFSFFKFEPGAPVPFNPSIISVAERMSHMPGVKRGSDYHYHAKKLLELAPADYEFPNEIYTKVISGVSFDVMPTKVTVSNRIVYQEYYAARVNDYVLALILSYSSDSELDELSNIINRLEFSKL
jgi:hypothetical protein